jgi:hypothetical protein
VVKVTAPSPVLPELARAIPGIIHAILDTLVDKDTPKAPGETPDLVKNLIPTVKTAWAEEEDEGDDAASEDSSMWPSPAAGYRGAPIAGPNPPTGFPSQHSLPRGHARRQNEESSGSSGPGGGSGGGNVPWSGCPP